MWNKKAASTVPLQMPSASPKLERMMILTTTLWLCLVPQNCLLLARGAASSALRSGTSRGVMAPARRLSDLGDRSIGPRAVIVFGRRESATYGATLDATEGSRNYSYPVLQLYSESCIPTL